MVYQRLKNVWLLLARVLKKLAASCVESPQVIFAVGVFMKCQLFGLLENYLNWLEIKFNVALAMKK